MDAVRSERPHVTTTPCGHPDGNDSDRFAGDPIHKLLLGRDPVAGGRLA